MSHDMKRCLARDLSAVGVAPNHEHTIRHITSIQRHPPPPMSRRATPIATVTMSYVRRYCVNREIYKSSKKTGSIVDVFRLRRYRICMRGAQPNATCLC